MMINEEESLKTRLVNSIQTCRAEMEKLCMELQCPVFQVIPVIAPTVDGTWLRAPPGFWTVTSVLCV